MPLEREICHHEPTLVFEEDKDYMFDLICESIFPRAWRLFEDIKRRAKEGEKKWSYTRDNLMELAGKDWKFYESLKKLPEDFTLTMLRCHPSKIQELSNVMTSVYGTMMEFADPRDWKKEFIWLNEEIEDEETFDNLLLHELGHVWTFAFGSNDESFTEGQVPGCESMPDSLSRFQIDVLRSFYNGNFMILEKDCKYFLGKHGNETFASEFAPIVDELIEFLVNWWLENESSAMSLEEYLVTVEACLSSHDDFSGYIDSSIPKLSFVKNFRDLSSYKKNCVRRLMLLAAFGSNEQLSKFWSELNRELS